MRKEPNNFNFLMNKDEKKISNKKEKPENSENKYETEIKINRIHRLSPANLSNIPEEEKSNSNLNFHYKTPSNKKKKRELSEGIFKEEVEKEINKRRKIHQEYLNLHNLMKKKENISKSNNDSKDKQNEIFYYIINKTWLRQFKNYYTKTDLTYSNINEDYPGQINNQHLILKEQDSLKLIHENRIILNPKYSDNCTCVSQEIWNFLINLCGGGPEIKFYPHKINNVYDTDEISTIRRCVHINLLFLPKKQILSNNNNKEPSDNMIDPLNPFQSQDVKNILQSINNNNEIQTGKIYFDITKNVKELINYINLILNQNKKQFTNTPIFFGPSFNLEGNGQVENLNYRLWLLILNNKEDIRNIIDIIQEQITKYEDPDFLMNFIQINNNIYNINITPYLLTDFLKYKVSDIFPNKYTNNFDNTDYYNKLEDEDSMPEMYILIEEKPFHFYPPKRNYLIKKCNQCNCKDYVFSPCQCQKVFYCSEECKKANYKSHIITCKICIYNILIQKNENLYKILSGRKEYYEKNKIEKEKFPVLGLTNLGNSCYMNSSLQCLFATKELSDYFIYNFNEKYINKENILGSGGILTLAYVNLLLSINNTTNNKNYTPDSFKIILGLCSTKFEGNEQEDAHEFISYLLDVFHEDVNRVRDKTNNEEKNIKYKKEMTEEEKSIIDWNNFLRRNQSVLIDLFYGQLKSSIICPLCKFKSINFNPFLSLELSINQEKNFNLINIEFIDYYSESPTINFNIVLYNIENKVYFVRKKIANLLNIDLLSFELAIVHKNKIIHIFDLNDEINSDIINIVAYRVNPEFFYSKKNERYNEIINNENNTNSENNENNYINSINNKYRIDFPNLEFNINKRKNEIIKYNENENRSINDDLFSMNLLYQNNIGLDSTIFQRIILENFTLKKSRSKNIYFDEIIYLEKNKSCADIYFQIFKKYIINIICQSESSKERNDFFNLYKSEENETIIRKKFNQYFGEINVDMRPSQLDLVNNFPNVPFVLFLQNDKYNVQELIPISTDINYQDKLKVFYDGINFEKNKSNQSRQYNSIKKINREEPNEINEINKENNNNIYPQFDKLITDILKENKENKNSTIKSKNQQQGLKGGQNDNDNKSEESSEADAEESENSENNENNENNENEYDENNIENNDNDSTREINMNMNMDNESSISIESRSFSSQSDYNSSNISPRRRTAFKELDEEYIYKLRNEKDENMDRIIIMWNRKYLKHITRFTDINLYDICDKMYEKSTNQEIKLEKLISEFSKEEKLDRDNLYKCEQCHQESEANKKIEIYHVPKILIIHLKRFNNNKKINTFIEYPLTDLDISNYVQSKDNISKYDLFGVINHFGSIEYGHYTSYCFNYHDNIWYEFNDRIVNKIPKEKEKDIIVNKGGYILFYRAKDNKNINWDNIYKKEYENINENNLKKYGQNFTFINNEINVEQNDERNINKENEDIIIEKKEDNVPEINIEEKNNEIDDDNFSFKEGMNNKSINNINETELNNENNPVNETPKFKNKIEKIEEVNDLINFDLDESNNNINTPIINKERIDIKKQECKSEIKSSEFLFNSIKITKANTFRIQTFYKPRKKEIKKEQKLNSDKNKDENELLKYNIFNQSRNYFKLNPRNTKNTKKGINSVKNKELSLFILKELCNNKSNNVPRSKKLYNDISEEKKEKLNSIKEEESIDIEKEKENANTKVIKLEDYVYNPFKNCYAKLRKF